MQKLIDRYSSEAIAWQNDDDFINALLSKIEELRTYYSKLEMQNLYKGSAQLSVMLSERFGMNFTLMFTKYAGSHITIPNVAKNPLFGNIDKNFSDLFTMLAYETDALGTFVKNLNFTVDNKKARVLGFPQDIRFNINIEEYLLGDSRSVREAAAVIIHEVGHAFDWADVMGRAATENTLTLICNAYLSDPGVAHESKLKVVSYMTKSDKMFALDHVDFVNSSHDFRLGVSRAIVSQMYKNSGISNPIHEMSERNEIVADSFATNFGFGRELANNLDDTMRAIYKSRNRPGWSVSAQSLAKYIVSGALLIHPHAQAAGKGALTNPLFIKLIAVAVAIRIAASVANFMFITIFLNKPITRSSNPKYRAENILVTLRLTLRDPNVSKEDKAKIIETIDYLSKEEFFDMFEELPFGEKIKLTIRKYMSGDERNRHRTDVATGLLTNRLYEQSIKLR